MNGNAREAIMEAAKKAAQTRGYAGLNFRDIGRDVGIKSASIHYHFPSKADLGAAVARRYWEDTQLQLEAMLSDCDDPQRCLSEYPEIFRMSLVNGNRLCLGSFMAAQHDELPEPVRLEVQTFADVNVAWLTKVLASTSAMEPAHREPRARAIFAAVAGAQLIARSRNDVQLFDDIIDQYRAAGLLSP